MHGVESVWNNVNCVLLTAQASGSSKVQYFRLADRQMGLTPVPKVPYHMGLMPD
jgi:hypothetical protein